MSEEGFRSRIDVETGIVEMAHVISSGKIANPTSIYYSNVKWLMGLGWLGTGARFNKRTLQRIDRLVPTQPLVQ
jgi:hypothetical protein